MFDGLVGATITRARNLHLFGMDPMIYTDRGNIHFVGTLDSDCVVVDDFLGRELQHGDKIAKIETEHVEIDTSYYECRALVVRITLESGYAALFRVCPIDDWFDGHPGYFHARMNFSPV